MNEVKQMGNEFDVVIVGGGIVGAATLHQLQQRYPNRSMLLIEKEAGLADHQTGNNSGVIHSGLYYPPGSLKAKNCVEGRRALVRFAQEHKIPHDVCGKVVVAVEDSEAEDLEEEAVEPEEMESQETRNAGTVASQGTGPGTAGPRRTTRRTRDEG